MELWIRSQDKRILRKVSCIQCDDTYLVEGGYVLGEYKSEERCLEIINSIQHLIVMLSSTNNKIAVYEMPKE